MFKFFKKNNDNNNIVPAFGGVTTKSGSEIIDSYKEKIDLIYSTLQLSRENFDSVYIPFLEDVAFYIQSLPCFKIQDYEKSHGLLNICLLGGLNSIKKRRGFVLPPGTRTDIQDEQRSVWSYVIFTSAIITVLKNHILDCEVEVSKDKGKNYTKWDVFSLKPLGDYSHIRYRQAPSTENEEIKPVVSLFLCKEFIPENGLSWIKKYNVVFSEWCALTSHNYENIKWLHDFTDELYFCPTVGQEIYVEEIEDNNTEGEPDIVTNKVVPNSTKVVVTNNKAKTNKESFKPDEQKELSFKKKPVEKSKTKVSPKAKKTIIKPETDTADNKKIDAFVAWITESFNEGTLVLNRRDSAIHCLENGIFIVVPIIFKQYGKLTNFDERYLRELEMIIMNDTEYGFFKNASNSNVHVLNGYGKSNKGYIIPLNKLKIFNKPPINTEFTEEKTDDATALDSF